MASQKYILQNYSFYKVLVASNVFFGSFDYDCTPFCKVELAKLKLGIRYFYKD